MENKKQKGLWFSLKVAALFFVFFVFLFFRGSINIAWGGAGDSNNIAGFAWSSNFGWISFNCNNPPKLATCGVSNYGVGIKDFLSPSETFNFDGEAWSDNAGWITFYGNGNSSGIPDFYAFNSHCKNTCDSSTNCIACYNPDDGKIYGWAKVLSLKEDGWIQLRGTTTADVEFGIAVDQASASGTFTGWAWNGTVEKYKGLGWISFNCANPEGNSCASGNFNTYLAASHLPVPVNLSAPNYPTSTACALQTARGATLNWSFFDQDVGQTQWAYQVILNNSNSTTTPLLDTGKITGNATQLAVNSSILSGYNTKYYWWVKVWDTFGFVSKWMQFNTGTSGHVLTDNVIDNGVSPLTFTTYRREFPNAFFSRLPKKPMADAAVTSTDESFYYLEASPNTPRACDEANCQWYWSSPTDLSNSATTSSSTVMTFPYGPNQEIYLRVRDNGLRNYSCVTSSRFFVDKLPIWIEKKAQ